MPDTPSQIYLIHRVVQRQFRLEAQNFERNQLRKIQENCNQHHSMSPLTLSLKTQSNTKKYPTNSYQLQNILDKDKCKELQSVPLYVIIMKKSVNQLLYRSLLALIHRQKDIRLEATKKKDHLEQSKSAAKSSLFSKILFIMLHKMKSIISYPLEHIDIVNLHAKRAQSKFTLLIYTHAEDGKKSRSKIIKTEKKRIRDT